MLGKPPVVDKEAVAPAPTSELVQPEDLRAVHQQLTRDSSIQFEMQPFRPEPPLFDFNPDFGAAMHLAPVLRVLFWVVVALIVAWLLYLIASRLTGFKFQWRRKTKAEAEPEWRPAEQPARQLLGEADALAAAGRYSEAAHLLLFRSIEEIEQRRPDSVRKAYTSRDIARLPALPPSPRQAFGKIVGAVERSLFGGRMLGASDWQECRAAYERFAFAQDWRG